MWPVIGQERELRPLHGTVSASFERGDAERQRGALVIGDIKLRDVRWDKVLWSNQLRAEVGVGEASVANKLLERKEGGTFADCEHTTPKEL